MVLTLFLITDCRLCGSDIRDGATSNLRTPEFWSGLGFYGSWKPRLVMHASFESPKHVRLKQYVLSPNYSFQVILFNVYAWTAPSKLVFFLVIKLNRSNYYVLAWHICTWQSNSLFTTIFVCKVAILNLGRQYKKIIARIILSMWMNLMASVTYVLVL